MAESMDCPLSTTKRTGVFQLVLMGPDGLVALRCFRVGGFIAEYSLTQRALSFVNNGLPEVMDIPLRRCFLA